METSKLTTVLHTGSKDWNGKTLEKFTVAFENGMNGTLTVFPNQPTPSVGEEMEFEVVDNGFGNEIKPKKKGGTGGGFSKWTPEQVAQQDAIKLTCAYIEHGHDLKFWKQFFVEAKQFMLVSIKDEKPPVAQKPEDEKGTVDDLPF